MHSANILILTRLAKIISHTHRLLKFASVKPKWSVRENMQFTGCQVKVGDGRYYTILFLVWMSLGVNMNLNSG